MGSINHRVFKQQVEEKIANYGLQTTIGITLDDTLDSIMVFDYVNNIAIAKITKEKVIELESISGYESLCETIRIIYIKEILKAESASVEIYNNIHLDEYLT